MSIHQFISYKYILSKENKLNKKIHATENLYKKINSWYDSVTTDWVNDANISCQKFSKLEQRANYKKQKQLYKLGYSKNRPILPIFQNIYKQINPHKKINNTQLRKRYLKHQQYNIFKIISSKKNNFLPYIIPMISHKLAIKCAKKCIIGYRTLQNDINYFRNYLSYTSSIQYLKSIKLEALNELNSNKINSNFKDSLKVNISPNTTNTHPKNIQTINKELSYR